MATSKKPSRRQRRHGDLPAGFAWRDGRPRWVPSPARRKQGWKGTDLRDGWRNWLPRGAAIERAQAIADAVGAWARGEPVPAALLAIAPAGAERAAAPPGRLNPRSIGALLDGYLASADFKGEGEIGGLAPATQRDYRNKLTRFLQILAGAADKAKVETVRALEIDTLLPPAFNEPGEFEILRAYDRLRQDAGLPMANGVLAAVSAWLSWCVKKRRVWPTNPAELVERRASAGRIVVYDWPELVAMVRAAEAAGMPSIADAIILAVDLSWSQQDLLALTWGQISADGHARHRRIKTGVAGNPQLLAPGLKRVEAIRARWADAKVRPTHVLICEATGRPWKPDHFRHSFAEIRAAAAAKLPTLADKQFRDLRDTAITYGIDAGLSIEGVCSRSLHAPARAQAVISKHYGAIRQGLADEAAQQLGAHFERMGYNFDELLALPAPAAEG